MVAISDKRAVDATHSYDPLRYANHSLWAQYGTRDQQGRVAFGRFEDVGLAS